ncbi:MAG: LysR family transcriptional regulator, partial [Mycobacterium sp.]|nr:LysR family transcriptional regulator [Mycobacterium sp.]
MEELGIDRRGGNNLVTGEGHAATAITLHQLEIFAAIVREGGFSRAAAALLLSEPTISEQLKLLERAVGERLLERGPGRSQLDVTPAGHLLFETCAEIFGALERYQQHLRSQRREQQASMTFGFSQHFPSYPLPSLFASFRRQHPEIAVRVSLQLRQQLIESLRRGELELAALVPPVDEPGLVTETLAAFDQVLVGPAGHPLAQLSARVPFERLAHESFVMFEAPSVVRRELEVRAVSAGIG